MADAKCSMWIERKYFDLVLEGKLSNIFRLTEYCRGRPKSIFQDLEELLGSFVLGKNFGLQTKMGFEEQCCSWITHCTGTSSFSVLINGCPSDFFGSPRGFRQRDPLSPFLFIVVMEVLSLILDKATDKGLLKGLKVSSNGRSLEVSHCLFADDTFCEDDPLNILNLH
ncbi:uncharacterized protein LOC131155828 [Malania oleifera]|uniref:uncharacterized protein LOC131155828 n=1 Tax=Malania oleifera TaxID=397392 RepID=UPI0025ADE520|nr:uncharacterized protein LOC131155828 [Malania oleifera]